METLDFATMAVMAGMGFVAAFVDSVVGGGGLISVPTLMWAGLPMLNVLGTRSPLRRARCNYKGRVLRSTSVHLRDGHLNRQATA